MISPEDFSLMAKRIILTYEDCLEQPLYLNTHTSLNLSSCNKVEIYTIEGVYDLEMPELLELIKSYLMLHRTSMTKDLRINRGLFGALNYKELIYKSEHYDVVISIDIYPSFNSYRYHNDRDLFVYCSPKGDRYHYRFIFNFDQLTTLEYLNLKENERRLN